MPGIDVQELFSQGLNGRCGKCLRPAAMEIRVFMPAVDFVRDMPQMAMKIAAKNEGKIPVVMFRGPGGQPRKFVRALHAFACRQCRKELELWAAKAPSYAVVEIAEAPKQAIQVGAGS